MNQFKRVLVGVVVIFASVSAFSAGPTTIMSCKKSNFDLNGDDLKGNEVEAYANNCHRHHGVVQQVAFLDAQTLLIRSSELSLRVSFESGRKTREMYSALEEGKVASILLEKTMVQKAQQARASVIDIGIYDRAFFLRHQH